MPFVSVIIPTYNRESHLVEAIESVLDQSFQDFEVIIVDDGSTDGTAQIAEKYRNNLTYYYQKNKGPAAARNFGIKQAHGTFIAFLDSDDLWLPKKLETQINLIKTNPQIRICYTDEIWIRNGVRVNQKKVHRKYSGWIFPRCLPLCIISPSSVIIHRDVLDKVGLFNEDLIVCEDYELWLRISALYPVEFIKTPLIIKRGGHADQLSKKFWGTDRFRIRALDDILQKTDLAEADRLAAIDMLKKKCSIVANGCYKRGKKEEGDFYTALSKRY